MIDRAITAKVYFEGVEVPFGTVHITESVGQAYAQAQITLPPAMAIRRIEHRTLVHVFVKRTTHHADTGYECVFEGEVVAYGMGMNASGGRSFHVQAYSLGNYWDWAKLQYLDESTNNMSAAAQNNEYQKAKDTGEGGAVMEAGTVNQANTSPVVMSSQVMQAFQGRSFNDSIKWLFELLFTKSPEKKTHYQFAIDANDRLKLIERIIYGCGDVSKFINQEQMGPYLTTLVTGRGAFIDFSRVLSVICAALEHDFMSFAAPVRRLLATQAIAGQDLVKSVIQGGAGSGAASAVTGAAAAITSSATPGSYVFKPKGYFFAPPTCNVLFPGQYSGMSYARSFHYEHTRLYMQNAPAHQAVNAQATPETRLTLFNTVAPSSEFNGSTPLYTGRDGSIVDNAPLQSKSFDQVVAEGGWANIEYSYLTERELRSGCNPISMGWPEAALHLDDYQSRGDDRGGQAGDIQSRDSRYRNIADFQFWLDYYSVGRSQTVNCEYLPNIACGFSALLLDSSPARMHLVGYITHVVHYIQSGGGASTSISVDLCRETTEKRPMFGDSPLPPWCDASQFKDSVIGTAWYPSVLGEGVSSAVFVASTGEASDPIHAAAESLEATYSRHEQAGEMGAAAYMDSLTSRQRMSEEEIFGFLGAKRVNFSTFTGGSLDQARRSVIVDYIDELSFGALGR